ncbi:hypothetical protein LXL04_022787 [Taraxacum kok-saghyz]
MIDYISKLEDFFWENHEKDELVINELNVSILDQTLRLLELAETKGKEVVNQEISYSKNLKQLFHFEETINIMEEYSDNNSIYISEEEINTSKEELESLLSDTKPSFRMNRIEPQLNNYHPGESSYKGTRKRAKTEQDHHSTSAPDLPTGNPNQFGSNVLNIDNIETNRREVIDGWAS